MHLTALAVVPAIGLPIFAGLFTAHKLDEARAAGRIGRTMTMVVDLHDLRTALSQETAAASLRTLAAQYGLSMEQLADVLGDDIVTPVGRARARADEALAAVDPDADITGSMAAVRDRLDAARDTADRSLGTDPASVQAGWEMYQSYAELVRSVASLKETTIQRVITGRYGPGSSPLLTGVSELQRLTAVADLAGTRAMLLNGYYAATNADQRSSIGAELQAATSSWRRASTELASQVSAEVRASWVRLVSDDDVAAFERAIDDFLANDVVDVAPTPLSADLTRKIILFQLDLDELVDQAAAANDTVADGDRSSAEHRARLALAATLSLLLATAVLLFLIGGRLRGHLRALAVAAERFSAGRLEEMPVDGPREIATASGALNDAVASFRRVAVQAERLSAGDLDAPELQEAAPGALGIAVHASVQRIVEAVRERERLQDALAHQAAHDDLTRLPNRAETERLLGKALARANRGESRVAVLFVDLDHFKRCNDNFGHAAGDHVLRTAAARMTKVVRPGDTVCRLGGDEFVVVVEPVGNDRSVVEIAERVVTSLAEPIAFGNATITVGGTAGVAISDESSDADSLLREADSAMYQAKATARGTVGIFNDELRAELHQEADFRVAMAAALENDELELHYQPVLDIGSGRVKGFEALARWQRPGVGMVRPDQFIPLAEQSGLIIDIGQWALRAATAQLAEWSADPTYAGIQVAVNLSGRHLAQASVVDDVRAVLAASGLAPERLVIEITESIAIDNPISVNHLAQLAASGVRIAVDDFGTGYTSIGQLLHLPVHILKIDRSIVSGTSDDGTSVLERSTRIIDLIVEVAHSLELDVVAEGVEEQVQLDRLAAAHCDHAQGYLFSKPLPVDQVPGWVRDHNARPGRQTKALAGRGR